VVHPPPGPAPAPLAYPPQDRNETLLWGNPLLDPPETRPGWFASLGVDVVGPAIKQRVLGFVPLGDTTSIVELPTATLNWGRAPRLEVGYRLPEAVGELSLSYRLLATRGQGVIPNFDEAGAGALTSRLDTHLVFLDYSSREFSLWPHWDMKAHVGAC